MKDIEFIACRHSLWSPVVFRIGCKIGCVRQCYMVAAPDCVVVGISMLGRPVSLSPLSMFLVAASDCVVVGISMLGRPVPLNSLGMFLCGLLVVVGKGVLISGSPI